MISLFKRHKDVEGAENFPAKSAITAVRGEQDVPDEFKGMTYFMKRHAFFIKCVSLALSVVFLEQQIGWSQDGKPVWAQAKPFSDDYQRNMRLNGIQIPYDLAETQDASASGGEETIIHIQDSHASLSAQYSIASLLDSLVSSYDLGIIALEGGEGEIDTSLLKTFPDKEVREGTAGYLMKEGLMSAGEFFSVTRDGAEVKLYGVEDFELYEKNLESFRKVAEKRAEYISGIDALLAQIAAIDEKMCSKDLNELNIEAVLHREGQIGFSEYWSKVDSLSAKCGVQPEKGGDLERLITAVRLEKDIDFALANSERRLLIDELSPKMDKPSLEDLVMRSVSFKQNKISQSDFHSYLADLAEKHGVDAANYPNFIKFTRYISIYESIDLVRLFGEMEKFEEAIREKLYRSGEEKALNDIAKLARLLRNLYSMELTNGEGLYLKTHRNELDPARWSAAIRKAASKYKVQLSGGYDLTFITGGFDDAMTFYEDAEARDRVMLNRTVERMRQDGTKVAALITGGYHTEGMTELMKGNRLSYLVVMPKQDKDVERPYVAILTNKKGDYQKLLASGKYQLAVRLFFQRDLADPTRNLRELIPAILKTNDSEREETRKRLIDIFLGGLRGEMDWRGEWTGAYAESYSGAPGQATPEEMASFLGE
ncbi:MAG TPA: hypothetical protein PKZ41_02815, partial [Candidatus Omnitrophota bacterium]|nr:hypothetical protein [Candidatus Omnitrophota bacterium]